MSTSSRKTVGLLVYHATAGAAHSSQISLSLSAAPTYSVPEQIAGLHATVEQLFHNTIILPDLRKIMRGKMNAEESAA